MKYPYASLLLSLALLLPLTSSATRLPVGLILQWAQHIAAGQPDAIANGLAIPLTLNTELDSSQLSSGRKLFLRVSEDVMVNDDQLLFGAGAIACGYIRSNEKDAVGRCLSIEVELVRVQATDGSQVTLHAGLIRIKTQPADENGKVRVDAEVKGMVRAGV